jgi:hypothetical protein
MTLIKKADVKNHLSTRHRTEIHLYRPEEEPTVPGALEDASAGAAPAISDVSNDPPIPASPSGSETPPTVTASDPSVAVVSAQSQSAKA